MQKIMILLLLIPMLCFSWSESVHAYNPSFLDQEVEFGEAVCSESEEEEEEEEEAASPKYDAAIVYEQEAEIKQIKDEQYKDKFDEASQAEDKWEKAKTDYDEGKTDEKLSKAEKYYNKVKKYPNSNQFGTNALEKAKKKLDEARAADEAATKNVCESEENFEELQKESFKAQYVSHASDLNDHKTNKNTYAQVIEKHIMEFEMLFDGVPEITKDSDAAELEPLLEHLSEGIKFWKGYYEKETKRSSMALHKRCWTAIKSLYDLLKTQSEGKPSHEYAFRYIVAQYRSETNKLSYLEAKALAVNLKGEAKTNARIYAHFFKQNQFKLNKIVEKLREEKEGTSNTKPIILTFLGLAFVYIVYDLIKCIKEDRERYQ